MPGQPSHQHSKSFGGGGSTGSSTSTSLSSSVPFLGGDHHRDRSMMGKSKSGSFGTGSGADTTGACGVSSEEDSRVLAIVEAFCGRGGVSAAGFPGIPTHRGVGSGTHFQFPHR